MRTRYLLLRTWNSNRPEEAPVLCHLHYYLYRSYNLVFQMGEASRQILQRILKPEVQLGPGPTA